MIARCHNPNHPAYSSYGGRGITVCDAWSTDFKRFLADVGPRPSPRHSLERINNEDGYRPENVRWAESKEQVRNRRVTPRYWYRGEWLALGRIAELSGTPYERLHQRVVKHGWTVEEAVSTPVRNVDDGLYGRWYQMVKRCTDPQHERYADYGGRGIRVCSRWLESFENFKADVGLPPTPDAYMLDRIDNSGHYEPGNVRWTTPTVQNRNRRSTKLYEFRGEKRTLADWASRAGIDYPTVKRRLYSGWSLAEALGTPKDAKGGRQVWTPEPLGRQYAKLNEDEKKDFIERTVRALQTAGFPWEDIRSRREADPIRLVRQGKVLVDGNEILRVAQAGQATCLSVHLHRLKAKRKGGRSVVEAFSDEASLRRAVLFQLKHGDPVAPRRVVRALLALHRAPLNFPPVLARWLVDQYAPENGTVLDPCSGYGGRLLGALASTKNVTYVGADIEPESVAGNIELARLVGADRRVRQEQRAVEDSVEWPKADLVLAGPPYYDREDYGATSRAELSLYPTYRSWVEGFLRLLVTRSLVAAPRAIFNVAAIRDGALIYDLPSDLIRQAEENGGRIERVMTWKTAKFNAARTEKLIVVARL
jgi:hypothetical protein